MADPEVKVTELLNEAALTTEGPKKVRILAELKELLLHRAPGLLDKYFEDVLAFQNDPVPDVRKYSLTVFEEACRKEEKYLGKIVPALQNIIFNDENANVLKKAIQTAAGVYKGCLKWVSKVQPGSVGAREAIAAWDTVSRLKDYLVKQIDSDNDGIRTHAIKFMEAVILAQTYADKVQGKVPGIEVSLDLVPQNSRLLRPRRMEDDAKQVMENLLKFHSSIHISSVNLMATMAALTNIAKQRAIFMGGVIEAMQSLNSNLPPTLGKSQVSSVKKMMKVHMMTLLKLPSAMDHLPAITALLTDLGASYQEIMKNHPAPAEFSTDPGRRRDPRKRGPESDFLLPHLSSETSDVPRDPRLAKRPRRDFAQEMPSLPGIGGEDMDLDSDSEMDQTSAAVAAKASAVTPVKAMEIQAASLPEAAEAYICARLRPEVAVGVVVEAMLRLPSQVPQSFLDSYFPMSSAGTNKQIRLVSSMLGAKFIENDLFPYDKAAYEKKQQEKALAAEKEAAAAAEEAAKKKKEEEEEKAKLEEKKKPEEAVQLAATEPPKPTEKPAEPAEKPTTIVKPATKPPGPSGMSAMALKQLRITTERLSSRSKPLSLQTMAKIKTVLVSKISSDGPFVGRAEATLAPLEKSQLDIISTVGSLLPLSEALETWIGEFFGEDPARHVDVVIAWLYQEYGQAKKCTPCNTALLRKEPSLDEVELEADRYRVVMTTALRAVLRGKNDFVVHLPIIRRLFLETPSITTESVEIIAEMVPTPDEQRIQVAQTQLQRQIPTTATTTQDTKEFAEGEAPIDVEKKPPTPSETRANAVCQLLKDLVIYRSGLGCSICLELLLDLTAHPEPVVRENAIESVLSLLPLRDGEFAFLIGDYAVSCLKFLTLPRPPEKFVVKYKRFGGAMANGEVVDLKNEPGDDDTLTAAGEELTEDVKPETDAAGNVIGDGSALSTAPWSDEFVKLACSLVFSVLPKKPELLFELVTVFGSTTSETKRVILRLMEEPVKKLDVNAPEITDLLERFPAGSETFISRLIHIMTEKERPSPELVAKMMHIYKTKVTDVRFLIPVLGGMSKVDVIEALPKLLRLAPLVLKEVFNRILGLTGSQEDQEKFEGPLSPVDLMIEIHKIPPSACDVKNVIKGTSTCFGMKEVYDMEMLSVVLQGLIGLPEMPTLLMRTVIQAYALHPKLAGLVMNVLQQLVRKEVWNHPKIWEGFIKCCQRGGPLSCNVLMQLPSEQLKEVFKSAPELKDLLTRHVDALGDSHRSYIPSSVLEAVYGVEATRHMEKITEPPPPGAMEPDFFNLPPHMMPLAPKAAILGHSRYP